MSKKGIVIVTPSIAGFRNDTENHLDALHDMYLEYMNNAVEYGLSEDTVKGVTYTYSEIRLFLKEIAKREKELE
jgi:hypothetical protein